MAEPARVVVGHCTRVDTDETYPMTVVAAPPRPQPGGTAWDRVVGDSTDPVGDARRRAEDPGVMYRRKVRGWT